MKKLIERFRSGIESRLRKACGKITPGRRTLVIAVLLGIFAVANIWITFRAIYSIGREDQKRDVIKVTPLEVPGFDLGKEAPEELMRGMEEYFNQNFKTEENDTDDTEQEQAEL